MVKENKEREKIKKVIDRVVEKEVSKKKKKPNNKNIPTLQLKTEDGIAMDFAMKVYKKFDKIIKSIILFGSATKQTAVPGSDIDVMIVLKGEFQRWEMDKRSSEFVAALCLENDVVISRTFVSEMEYANSKMPLYINVRREGVAV